MTVRFRGREMAHTELGKALLDKFAERCQDVGNLDKALNLKEETCLCSFHRNHKQR